MNLFGMIIVFGMLAVLMVPIAMNYMILASELGLTLFMGGFGTWVFLLILIIKTPAMAWLSASFSRKIMIFNPNDNKFLDFRPAKQYGNLAYVKGKGFYIVKPDDVYIESTSKVPVSFNYGNIAIPFNLEKDEMAKKLGELGFDETEEVQQYVNELKAKEKSPVLNLLGKSVAVGSFLNFLNRLDRSDYIEAEISRRTAAQSVSKFGGSGNLMMIAVIAVIVMVGGALAFAIVTSMAPTGGGGGGGSPLSSEDMGVLGDLAASISDMQDTSQQATSQATSNSNSGGATIIQ